MAHKALMGWCRARIKQKLQLSNLYCIEMTIFGMTNWRQGMMLRRAAHFEQLLNFKQWWMTGFMLLYFLPTRTIFCCSHETDFSGFFWDVSCKQDPAKFILVCANKNDIASWLQVFTRCSKLPWSYGVATHWTHIDQDGNLQGAFHSYLLKKCIYLSTKPSKATLRDFWGSLCEKKVFLTAHKIFVVFCPS